MYLFIYFLRSGLAPSQCLHYLNQTLVSVVYLIFKTLFNYISVAFDKGNECKLKLLSLNRIGQETKGKRQREIATNKNKNQGITKGIGVEIARNLFETKD